MPATERAVELAQTAAQAAADKKAQDIVILDVADQLVITDAFLLASAPNERQVMAIVDAIEESLANLPDKAKPARREGQREGRWVLLDYIDLVVHVQHTEEREFYAHRAPREWLDALAPLGTDADKPFLEAAPVLIAIFARTSGVRPDGTREKHYYVSESVGIETGILITALHHAGLATLTHTPSPMGFLNRLLGRPAHERPFLLLVAGYPAEGARVPDITRKPLDAIASFR